MYLIDERTDLFIDRMNGGHFLLARLEELGVNTVAFISEFWRQNKNETEINLKFIRFGFKYNHVFNERLKKPLDHPTWREYVIECLSEPMEKNRTEIDRVVWAINNPGKPLPKELEYG